MKTLATKVDGETAGNFIKVCDKCGQSVSEKLREMIETECYDNKEELKIREEPKPIVTPLLESEIKDPSKVAHFRYIGNGEYIQEGVPESKAMRIIDLP